MSSLCVLYLCYTQDGLYALNANTCMHCSIVVSAILDKKLKQVIVTTVSNYCLLSPVHPI